MFMKKYAIIAKRDEKSEKLKTKLKDALDRTLEYDEEEPDIVISVGGDGTMLYSVHRYIDKLESVSFVGIHTGTLGFYTDYLSDEWQQLVLDIQMKDPEIVERDLLEVHYHEDVFYALNEMRIENNRRSQVIDVYISDEYLETFRGNGLLVCTSSGSTAYNKSIYGALLSPHMRAMELSEIAGINHNAYRCLGSSLILDETKYVLLNTLNYRNSVLCVDLDSIELTDNELVEVYLSDRTVRFLDYREVSFIERLKRAFL